jgi:dihydrofolate synthase / folylpolyglutamate synthase
MHESDLEHPAPALERKLRVLYDLRAAKNLDLGFRPEYLALLDALGNPHTRLPPVIHVAGTNGKGSTIATLRALLEAAGRRVHAYTSPHLRRFNERIVLGGRPIDDGPLETLIDRALEANAGREATFFEITTALAFAAFAENPADVLLLETGLGGRLDCTNIVATPQATIITALGLDHQDILGDAPEAIAAEKAGIIKPGIPCVLAPQSLPQVAPVIEARARALNAPLFTAGREWSICAAGETHMTFAHAGLRMDLPRPSLTGDHQIENAGNALMALCLLRERFRWNEDNIRNGLIRIEWPGRFEPIPPSGLNLPHDPAQLEIWYDGGHNESGARAIAAQLSRWAQNDPRPLHVILGLKGDKNARAFLEQVLPHAQSLTHINLTGVGYYLDEGAFEAIMTRHFPGRAFRHRTTLAEAIEALRPDIERTLPARILICGSLYLAKQLP